MSEFSMMPGDESDLRIPVGISSCLLGARVRFDGGHKRSGYISDVLSRFFRFVPMCPERAIGLPVPRQPIRLVRFGGETRARGTRDAALDVTTALTAYGEQVAAEADDLCGYIVKKASPSCGMERVKVYSAEGMPDGQGRGLFTAALMKSRPLLPVEEEGRLNDPRLRENFIARVFTLSRWKTLLANGLSPARLVDFHARHKFLLLAHDTQAYRQLGRLVADSGSRNLQSLADEYIALMMQTLKRCARPKGHVNVMQHLMGFLKRDIGAEDKRELMDAIETYGRGEYPLVVPVKLLQHHFRRNPNGYVSSQYYLNPHPRVLSLRNSL